MEAPQSCSEALVSSSPGKSRIDHDEETRILLTRFKFGMLTVHATKFITQALEQLSRATRTWNTEKVQRWIVEHRQRIENGIDGHEKSVMREASRWASLNPNPDPSHPVEHFTWPVPPGCQQERSKRGQERRSVSPGIIAYPNKRARTLVHKAASTDLHAALKNDAKENRNAAPQWRQIDDDHFGRLLHATTFKPGGRPGVIMEEDEDTASRRRIVQQHATVDQDGGFESSSNVRKRKRADSLVTSPAVPSVAPQSPQRSILRPTKLQPPLSSGQHPLSPPAQSSPQRRSHPPSPAPLPSMMTHAHPPAPLPLPLCLPPPLTVLPNPATLPRSSRSPQQQQSPQYPHPPLDAHHSSSFFPLSRLPISTPLLFRPHPSSSASLPFHPPSPSSTTSYHPLPSPSTITTTIPATNITPSSPLPKTKNPTRPAISTLYNSVRLPPEVFLSLQALAKSFMLSPSHPERRSCVGTRGASDAEMVRLRLYRCVETFLEEDRVGERFFGGAATEAVNDTTATSAAAVAVGAVPDATHAKVSETSTSSSGWHWPADRETIIRVLTPLLRRVVTNERQRVYAIDSRSKPSRRKSEALIPAGIVESQTRRFEAESDSQTKGEERGVEFGGLKIAPRRAGRVAVGEGVMGPVVLDGVGVSREAPRDATVKKAKMTAPSTSTPIGTEMSSGAREGSEKGDLRVTFNNGARDLLPPVRMTIDQSGAEVMSIEITYLPPPQPQVQPPLPPPPLARSTSSGASAVAAAAVRLPSRDTGSLRSLEELRRYVGWCLKDERLEIDKGRLAVEVLTVDEGLVSVRDEGGWKSILERVRGCGKAEVWGGGLRVLVGVGVI